MRPRLLESGEALRKIYPPRAEAAVPPARLRSFRGFVAQYKYNDIRTLFLFYPGGGLELRTRQRELVREYRMSPRMRDALEGLGLDRSKFHAIDGGILRHLVVRGETPAVLWDIIVHDSVHLLGTSYRSRYALLSRICGEPERAENWTGKKVGLQIHGKGPLWLAPIFREKFTEVYQSTLDADYLEGLLLKDPGAKLESGFRERNNLRWQIKVRKAAKAYMF